MPCKMFVISYCVFKNFQEECEAKMKVLEEAAGSAKKMSCHNEADDKVSSLKVRTYCLFCFT